MAQDLAELSADEQPHYSIRLEFPGDSSRVYVRLDLRPQFVEPTLQSMAYAHPVSSCGR